MLFLFLNLDWLKCRSLKLSGVIKFKKALDLFKTRFGEDYSELDIYDEFLLSKELDLFVYVDASICECTQKGTNNDSSYVNKVYPYNGYVRIPVDIRVHELFSGLKASIQIEEITGIYKSNENEPTTVKALLFSNELDCNFYSSIDDVEISDLIKRETAEQLNLKYEHLYFSRTQISKLGLKMDLNINLNISEPEKKWHAKEQRSIGLIISTLASLTKKIDISDPYSDSLETKLLQEIRKIDPKEKGISKGTLGKFLEYANESLK